MKRESYRLLGAETAVEPSPAPRPSRSESRRKLVQLKEKVTKAPKAPRSRALIKRDR